MPPEHPKYNIPVEIYKKAEKIKKRQKKKWDYVIVITGPERSSKSTLAAWIICALWGFFNFEVFQVTRQSMIKMIQGFEVGGGESGVLDEGMAAYKRMALDREQVKMNKIFSICGNKCSCLIICIPNIKDLDKYLLNHRVHCWIEVLDRGRAIEHYKDPNRLSEDRWRLKDIEKRIEKALKHRNPDNDGLDSEDADEFAYVEAVVRLPHVSRRLILYSQLPEEVEKEYNKVKEAGQIEMFEEDSREMVSVELPWGMVDMTVEN